MELDFSNFIRRVRILIVVFNYIERQVRKTVITYIAELSFRNIAPISVEDAEKKEKKRKRREQLGLSSDSSDSCIK